MFVANRIRGLETERPNLLPDPVLFVQVLADILLLCQFSQIGQDCLQFCIFLVVEPGRDGNPIIWLVPECVYRIVKNNRLSLHITQFSKEHNIAVNRVDVLQVVLVDAQAVLPVETMSASDPSRTCLLHIVIWVDDVENSVGVAALRGGEDNDLIERRDFLQKLLQERPKQRIHGDGVRAVCDLR